LGREEPDEVQQGQMQGAAPGEKQPHASVQAGADLLESRVFYLENMSWKPGALFSHAIDEAALGVLLSALSS